VVRIGSVSLGVDMATPRHRVSMLARKTHRSNFAEALASERLFSTEKRSGTRSGEDGEQYAAHPTLILGCAP